MHSSTTLAKRYMDFFRRPKLAEPSRLGEIYSPQILFRDPRCEIRGLVELEEHFSRLRVDFGDAGFEFLDELACGHSVYLKWHLHFPRPRSAAPAPSLRGVSHLRGGDRIEFHEDFYDPAAIASRRLSRSARIARCFALERAG